MPEIKLSLDDLEMILTWNACTVNEFGPNTDSEEALVARLQAWRDDEEARGNA